MIGDGPRSQQLGGTCLSGRIDTPIRHRHSTLALVIRVLAAERLQAIKAKLDILSAGSATRAASPCRLTVLRVVTLTFSLAHWSRAHRTAVPRLPSTARTSGPARNHL